jgi:DUF4097 and DUF4098 domain-containing protein YvlB
LTFTRNRTGVAVMTRYPQNEGVEVAVEYTIHVPHGAKVEHLGTVNGTLRVAGVNEVDELHTVNGNIEVYEADSEVHAHTTNGNVHLELSHVHGVSGTVAETTNGSVILAVPANAQADLEARCLNGNFQSRAAVGHGRLAAAARNPRETGAGRIAHQAAHRQRRNTSGGAAHERVSFLRQLFEKARV